MDYLRLERTKIMVESRAKQAPQTVAKPESISNKLMLFGSYVRLFGRVIAAITRPPAGMLPTDENMDCRLLSESPSPVGPDMRMMQILLYEHYFGRIHSLMMEPDGCCWDSIMEQYILTVFGLVGIVLRCTLITINIYDLMMESEGRHGHSIMRQIILTVFGFVGIVLTSTLAMNDFSLPDDEAGRIPASTVQLYHQTLKITYGQSVYQDNFKHTNIARIHCFIKGISMPNFQLHHQAPKVINSTSQGDSNKPKYA
ncbi:hypothetical protein EVAR_72363_1 [Eumeta japonica]|uniref:Uncharacterized protein n=1 Tax=Eumeta variegata TaxID=151549 RepID=A0A4C1SPE1_EUMVA|nr:hypothetical protein EVAR_72363_1 [Eumeta japonica]